MVLVMAGKQKAGVRERYGAPWSPPSVAVVTTPGDYSGLADSEPGSRGSAGASSAAGPSCASDGSDGQALASRVNPSGRPGSGRASSAAAACSASTATGATATGSARTGSAGGCSAETGSVAGGSTGAGDSAGPDRTRWPPRSPARCRRMPGSRARALGPAEVACSVVAARSDRLGRGRLGRDQRIGRHRRRLGRGELLGGFARATPSARP